MLADYKILKLWRELSNAFNVHVRDITVGKQDNNECTVVIVDEKTAPDLIAVLPKKFANEVVTYKTSGPIAGVAGCGQPAHQCACGTGAPKP